MRPTGLVARTGRDGSVWFPVHALRRITTLPAMRLVMAGLCLALLAGSCSSDDEPVVTSTTAPPTTATTVIVPTTPASVVDAWIDAVVAADAAALSELVEPAGFVILAGIENGYSESQITALLKGGVPAELLTQYWTTFKGSFADVAGIPLQAIEVGSVAEFAMGDVPFAVVEITSGNATTVWITSSRTGDWKFDLIASFGPAFAGQLRRLLAGLVPGPDADTIRAAYREDVFPGLLAAFRQNPGNAVLAAELERMTLLLDD